MNNNNNISYTKSRSLITIRKIPSIM